MTIFTKLQHCYFPFAVSLSLPYIFSAHQTTLSQCCLFCSALFLCGNTQDNLPLFFAGVFTTTIDQQQQKVTVTGSVGVETLIRKLVRAGKHAEIWPENNVKSSGKEKKRNQGRDTEKLESHSAENKKSESAENCNKESKSSNSKTGENSPEKSPAGDHAPLEDHKGGQSGGGGSGKKKKKKGQSGGSNGSNGFLSSGSSNAPAHTGFKFQNQGQVVRQEMGQVNLSPTRQQPYLYTETGYPPMVYVAAYNRLYPMGRMGGPCYYVPPSPYMCAGLDQDSFHQFQSRPLVSFEIFSDENANGCSIM